MDVSNTIKIVIGLTIGAIVIANVLPSALNTLANTSLTDTTANSLWTILPLLFVVAVVIYVIAQAKQ